MAAIKSVKALTGCAAGLEITDDFRKAVKYQVEYESGSVRYYDVDKAPKTVLSWIDSHREPEPEQEPEETPMERAENFAQQMLQLPVTAQDKAWKELETVLNPDELETAKKYVGSYHLLTDQAFYNATRDALAEELYQELHEPELPVPVVESTKPDTVSPVAVSKPLVQATPETEPDTACPVTVSPLACVQLAALFIAGVGVYTLWWIVQAFSIIEGGIRWILPRARAGVVIVVDALSMIRAWAAESFSFREMILTENGSMGRV